MPFSSAECFQQGEAYVCNAKIATTSVEPNMIPHTGFTTFTYTYTQEAGTIQTGGGITVDFKYVIEGVEYDNTQGLSRPQHNSDFEENYVSVRSTNNNVVISNIDKNKIFLEVIEGTFENGDEINLTYGDRQFRSPGFEGTETSVYTMLSTHVDMQGNGNYVSVESPELWQIGTKADRVRILAPSTPDEDSFFISVTVIDAQGYVVENFEGTLFLNTTDREGLLPARLEYALEDRGSKKVEVTLPTKGIQTVSVSDQVLPGKSNPILVKSPFGKNIYWGDTHAHSFFSSDGNNPPTHLLYYAQNVSLLDFVSFADHDERPFGWFANDDLNPVRWGYLQKIISEAHTPGEFVPFIGYEWSNTVVGHRTVVLLDDQGDYCAQNNRTGNAKYVCISLEELFEFYGDSALMIPHHPAWVGKGAKAGTWKPEGGPDPSTIEINSHHGSSEFYNNPYIIHNRTEQQVSEHSGGFVTYALNNESLKSGIIGGGDNHYAIPGTTAVQSGSNSDLYRPGLQATMSKDLTRDALFEEQQQRHTYATTGERIILFTKIDKARMGDEISLSQPPLIDIYVVGTTDLLRVELIRDGEVIQTWDDLTDRASLKYTDYDITNGEHNYYVRVTQDDYFGQDVIGNDLHSTAWSSPIWVDYELRFTQPVGVVLLESPKKSFGFVQRVMDSISCFFNTACDVF